MPIEREDSITAAVEKKQFVFLIDGEPTRIGDTGVIAEGAERAAVAIERKESSISVDIDAGCACYEEGSVFEAILDWLPPLRQV